MPGNGKSNSGSGNGNGGANGGNGHGAESAEPAAAPDSVPTSRPAGKTVKCPQCGKPAAWTDNPSRPFCSERCRLIDLGQWADGTYAIPAEPVPGNDDEEER